jgi:hypothetical protein
MDKFVKKLEKLIQSELPGSQFLTEIAKPRVGGTILWVGFAGKDQVERQGIIRTLIRDHLEADEQLKVSLIVTLTPQEYEIITQESA